MTKSVGLGASYSGYSFVVARGVRFELVTAVLAVGLVAFLSTFSGSVREAKNRMALAQDRRRIAAQISSWGQLTFQSVRSNEFSAYLAGALLNCSPQLKQDDAIEGLNSTVRSFFDYQLNPTLERFIYDRTNGANYRVHLKGATAKLLSADPNGVGSVQIHQSLSEVAAAWRILRESSRRAGVDSLDAIALNTFRVETSATTNPPISGFIGAAKECTFVGRSFRSGIEYPDDLYTRSKRGKLRLYAEVSFIGKFSPSGKASPIHAFWVWSDVAKRWIPETLLFDMQCQYASLF